MRYQRPRRRRGFTLMEVLLVLAILVILGSLVGIAFTRMQRRGYEGGAQLQIDLFKDALRTYHMDFGRYPENLEDLREHPAAAMPIVGTGRTWTRRFPPIPGDALINTSSLKTSSANRRSLLLHWARTAPKARTIFPIARSSPHNSPTRH